MYQKINVFLQKFLKQSTIIKRLFNISPMYKRSAGKIIEVSDDISRILVRIKLSWKNVNYNGSMFGGSMFSAADPIYMIQYMELLGRDYVVWDKSASIQFKRPAKEHVYAEFIVDIEEIAHLKKLVHEKGAHTFFKTVQLTNKEKTKVFAIAEREIYLATKEYYKRRQQERQREKAENL